MDQDRTVDLAADFDGATTPFRRDLIVHCYRLTGSIDEAEDLTQDTLVRAWRSRHRYDPELASLRTWLHRIATNVCLTALQGRPRRPLPSGLGAASDDPHAPLVPDFEIPWLQPLPGRWCTQEPVDPESRAIRRSDLRLAMMAALQRLPARQRAALVLRDVLQFSAAEVAVQLSSTPAAVNSALQRARATLALADPSDDEPQVPTARTVEAVIDRYVRAFESADVTTLVSLLTEEVVLEMPPVPLWYRGRADYGDFIDRIFALRGVGWRMLPLRANDQPALAAYCPEGSGRLRLHTVQLLTVTGIGISHTVVFQDPVVFAAFDLPDALRRD